jgi:hypothetical protein
MRIPKMPAGTARNVTRLIPTAAGLTTAGLQIGHSRNVIEQGKERARLVEQKGRLSSAYASGRVSEPFYLRENARLDAVGEALGGIHQGKALQTSGKIGAFNTIGQAGTLLYKERIESDRLQGRRGLLDKASQLKFKDEYAKQGMRISAQKEIMEAEREHQKKLWEERLNRKASTSNASYTVNPDREENVKEAKYTEILKQLPRP